jgi:hypothetical protein
MLPIIPAANAAPPAAMISRRLSQIASGVASRSGISQPFKRRTNITDLAAVADEQSPVLPFDQVTLALTADKFFHRSGRAASGTTEAFFLGGFRLFDRLVGELAG